MSKTFEFLRSNVNANELLDIDNTVCRAVVPFNLHQLIALFQSSFPDANLQIINLRETLVEWLIKNEYVTVEQPPASTAVETTYKILPRSVAIENIDQVAHMLAGTDVPLNTHHINVFATYLPEFLKDWAEMDAKDLSLDDLVKKYTRRAFDETADIKTAAYGHCLAVTSGFQNRVDVIVSVGAKTLQGSDKQQLGFEVIIAGNVPINILGEIANATVGELVKTPIIREGIDTGLKLQDQSPVLVKLVEVELPDEVYNQLVPKSDTRDKLLQIIMPDSSGKYPGEDGYDEGFDQTIAWEFLEPIPVDQLLKKTDDAV